MGQVVLPILAGHPGLQLVVHLVLHHLVVLVEVVAVLVADSVHLVGSGAEAV